MKIFDTTKAGCGYTGDELVELSTNYQTLVAGTWPIAQDTFSFVEGDPPEAGTMTEDVAVFTDEDPPEPGVAAEHSEDPSGFSYSKIYVSAIAASGTTPQDVAAAYLHEWAEAKLDRDCNLSAQAPEGFLEAFELCDPVEGCDTVDTLSTGTPVAYPAFVYPSYFDPNGLAPFDSANQLTSPFSIAPQGYALRLDLSNPTAGWQPVFPSAQGKFAFHHLHFGSQARLERRRATMAKWKPNWKMLLQAALVALQLAPDFPGKAQIISAIQALLAGNAPSPVPTPTGG